MVSGNTAGSLASMEVPVVQILLETVKSEGGQAIWLPAWQSYCVPVLAMATPPRLAGNQGCYHRLLQPRKGIPPSCLSKILLLGPYTELWEGLQYACPDE